MEINKNLNHLPRIEEYIIRTSCTCEGKKSCARQENRRVVGPAWTYISGIHMWGQFEKSCRTVSFCSAVLVGSFYNGGQANRKRSLLGTSATCLFHLILFIILISLTKNHCFQNIHSFLISKNIYNFLNFKNYINLYMLN